MHGTNKEGLTQHDKLVWVKEVGRSFFPSILLKKLQCVGHHEVFPFQFLVNAVTIRYLY